MNGPLPQNFYKMVEPKKRKHFASTSIKGGAALDARFQKNEQKAQHNPNLLIFHRYNNGERARLL